LSKVFVDTAAWIALFNKRDALHVSARQMMDTLQQQNIYLLTTDFVLLEVADAFCATSMRRLTVDYINRLRLLNSLEIVPVSSALLTQGWHLYQQRLDKSWGLTDCISFTVMAQAEITQAFTSDHHFEQAGYVKLL
jgi:uncharacterized protein